MLLLWFWVRDVATFDIGLPVGLVCTAFICRLSPAIGVQWHRLRFCQHNIAALFWLLHLGCQVAVAVDAAAFDAVQGWLHVGVLY